MSVNIHYHGGGACTPHYSRCNLPGYGITTANWYDCYYVPATGLYQCSHHA
jgi:hypothetical protein